MVEGPQMGYKIQGYLSELLSYGKLGNKFKCCPYKQSKAMTTPRQGALGQREAPSHQLTAKKNIDGQFGSQMMVSKPIFKRNMKGIDKKRWEISKIQMVAKPQFCRKCKVEPILWFLRNPMKLPLMGKFFSMIVAYQASSYQ